LELVVPLAPTPVAEKYVTKDELDQPTPKFPLDLYLCLDCGHVQLLDVVDPKFLFDNYTYLSSNNQPPGPALRRVRGNNLRSLQSVSW